MDQIFSLHPPILFPATHCFTRRHHGPRRTRSSEPDTGSPKVYIKYSVGSFPRQFSKFDASEIHGTQIQLLGTAWSYYAIYNFPIELELYQFPWIVWFQTASAFGISTRQSCYSTVISFLGGVHRRMTESWPCGNVALTHNTWTRIWMG